MKLVVQIPCLNEEETLPLVFEKMPRHIPGIESIEYLVIDDGSRDRTLDVATELGVQHLVRHVGNMGLGQSFRDGIHKALEVGADILVNTDGDNQYPSEMIPELVQPIIEGRADIVIADRQTHTIEDFSPLKKVLQRVGSRVVSQVAGVDLPDAASGFRAYSARRCSASTRWLDSVIAWRPSSRPETSDWRSRACRSRRTPRPVTLASFAT